MKVLVTKNEDEVVCFISCEKVLFQTQSH